MENKTCETWVNVLNLTIKKKWFDMIKSGEKKEEYRDIKTYWGLRLLWCPLEAGDFRDDQVFREVLCDLRTLEEGPPAEILKYFEYEFRKFDIVRFRNGYRKNSPTIDVECKRICVGVGYEEWGAKPWKNYFVIELGEVVK